MAHPDVHRKHSEAQMSKTIKNRSRRHQHGLRMSAYHDSYDDDFDDDDDDDEEDDDEDEEDEYDDDDYDSLDDEESELYHEETLMADDYR